MKGSGWRIGAAIGEAVRNVRASAARTLIVLFALSVSFGSLAWLELDFTRGILGFAERFEREGGYAAVVYSDEGPLPSQPCEALNTQPHIRSAGGVRTTNLISFRSAPGTLFQQADVTQGIIRVWDPSARSLPVGGAYGLGRAAARELGVSTGIPVAPVGEPTHEAYVVDPSLRNPQVARWQFDIVPAMGVIDQCWVELAPGAYSAGLGALPAQFPHHDVGVRPVVALDAFARDPLAELRDRPHRNAWLPVAGGLVAIYWLLSWFRRSEAGMYRAFGLPRLGVLIMHQIETLLLGAGSFVAGLSWATALHSYEHGLPSKAQISLAAVLAGKALFVTLAAAPLGAHVAGLGNPASLLKDRG